MSSCVFNFNILALILFEILWGPKFTLGSPVPPCIPLSGKKFRTRGEYFTISNVVRVMIAKYRKSGIWGYRSSLTPEPVELK